MPTKKLLTPIDEILITLKSLVKQINTKFSGVDKQFSNLKKEVDLGLSEQDKRFDSKFFQFKSDIHSLVDKKIVKKIKDHNDEIGILNSRTSNLRRRVQKLESLTGRAVPS